MAGGQRITANPSRVALALTREVWAMSVDGRATILAIDLGTSGPKVALVSTDGHIVADDFESVPLLLLPGGGAEQDPADWWRAIKKALRRLLARSGVRVADIIAVSCTGQWSGTVAVDRAGDPLMNAIIWLDSRGAPFVRRVTGGPVQIEGYGIGSLFRWIRCTGGIPSRMGRDSIAHILYIKHKLPEVYGETYKFLEPKDYLNLRLTGRFAASYDSITLHWVTDNRDLTKVAYDDGLIRRSTIEREKLPELRRAVDILGPIRPEVADELGLERDVQVVMGAPDVQSAAIGSGAVRDYEPHLYIGTSSWLACHVPFKKIDLAHNIASLPSAIPQRYLVSNEQGTSGGCLTFLKDNVLYQKDELLERTGQPDIYKVLDSIAEQAPPGSGRVMFTPWLYGERTPVADRFVRSAFVNISLDTQREHLVRAVFEGVAYNARWLLGYVEKLVKRRMEAINIVGGGANSDIWCQIHADVLNRRIRQVRRPTQANTRGAACLASVALGHLAFEDIPECVEVARTYEPDPTTRPVYDDLFREFVGYYKRNRRMYARLNRTA